MKSKPEIRQWRQRVTVSCLFLVLVASTCIHLGPEYPPKETDPSVPTKYGQVLMFNVNVIGGDDGAQPDVIVNQYLDMQDVYMNGGNCKIQVNSIIDAPGDPTFDIQSISYPGTEFTKPEYDLYFDPNQRTAPPDALALINNSMALFNMSTHSRLIEVFVVDRVFANPRGAPPYLTQEAGGLSQGPTDQSLPDEPYIYLSGQIMSAPDSVINGQDASWRWVFAHEMGHELGRLTHTHTMYNVMNDSGRIYVGDLTPDQCAKARSDTVHLGPTPF